MGERAHGVRAADGEAGASGRIAKEIEGIREEIATLVDDLDRRRRELFDVRLQMSRHPVAVSVAGLAVATLIGTAVTLLVLNGRRKQRPSYKAKQLRVAVGRMIDHPERVARGEAPPGEKILAAVGTAVASLLVRRAMQRAVPEPRAAAAARGPRPEQQREDVRH